MIGAAGGVGSILVQLAKQLTQLKVIGTASRPETQAWLKNLGVDAVINHRNKLSEVPQQARYCPTSRMPWMPMLRIEIHMLILRYVTRLGLACNALF